MKKPAEKLPIPLHPIPASPGLIKIITYNNSCGVILIQFCLIQEFFYTDTKTHNSLGNPDAKMIVLV